MSQVGAISKAQIKSKEYPLETNNFEKKSHSAEKKLKGGGGFSHVRFCRLRLKVKKQREDPLE